MPAEIEKYILCAHMACERADWTSGLRIATHRFASLLRSVTTENIINAVLLCTYGLIERSRS